MDDGTYLDGIETFKTSVFPTAVNSADLKHISRDPRHFYLQFNFDSDNIPHQGFKIHISSTIKNYQIILDTIFDFCKRNSITFKYISNKIELEKNLSGLGSLWSSGKFITIYPPDPDTFKIIINKLYSIKLLQSEAGIEILTDRRFKDSNTIFYRYGVLFGNDKNIYYPSGDLCYADYQDLDYKLPDFINEPFPVNSDDSKKAEVLFKKVFPIKAINNKPSGSVFLAKDLDNNLFVLKNAKYGYGDLKNTTIEQLKSEKNNLLLLSSFNCFPRYINSFFEDKDFFLMEEFIDGISVDTYRASTEYSFITCKDKAKAVQRYSLLMKNFLKNIQQLHNKNIYLGDISSANTIIKPSIGSIYFVDLAQTKKLTDSDTFSYKTVGFFDDKAKNLTLEEQDIHQTGYLFMSLFCRANMFLKIDPTGKTSINFFKRFAEVYKIPSYFVDIIETLINHPNTNLNNIITKFNTTNTSYLTETTSNDNLVDLHTLYLKLHNSIISAKLDKLNFDLDGTTLPNPRTDLLSTDHLLKIEFSIIEHKGKISKLIKSEQIQTQILNTLKYFCTHFDANKDYFGHLHLSRILSLIFCSIYLISENNQYIGYLRFIFQALDIIQNNYLIKQNDVLSYLTSLRSTTCSPYLSDGTAGVLNIFILIKQFFSSCTYDKSASTLANQLCYAIMPKSVTFSRGLSGIIYVLLKYKNSTQTKEYDTILQTMAYNIPYYIINWNDNQYVTNDSFSKLSVNFRNGNAGVLFTLKYLFETFD